MYLSRFGVKNYKCLGEIDIPLTPIHVIIGENDAGKTSLLEAMAALHASSEVPVAEIFPRPWQGRELVLHGSSESSVELSGEWSTPIAEGAAGTPAHVGYGFGVNFPNDGAHCTVFEEWVASDGASRTKVPLHPRITGVCRWRRGELPGNDVANDIERIASIIKPAHKYALDAKIMALPATIDSHRKFRLDQDGFGLATLLGDIVGYEPELFIQLRARFCEYFEQFKSVRTESEDAQQRTRSPDGIWQSRQGTGTGIYFETRTGQMVRAQQASDGAILFLGILALAHLPDPPNLLLIEEPENGIYPKRLGEVITMLKELVTRTDGVRFPQIIMTTHSPYVLSFFEPEEVTFLSRPADDPDGPVRARPLRDAPNIKERLGDDFYLGELWYNLSEEELFGES